MADGGVGVEFVCGVCLVEHGVRLSFLGLALVGLSLPALRLGVTVTVSPAFRVSRVLLLEMCRPLSIVQRFQWEEVIPRCS